MQSNDSASQKIAPYILGDITMQNLLLFPLEACIFSKERHNVD